MVGAKKLNQTFQKTLPPFHSNKSSLPGLIFAPLNRLGSLPETQRETWLTVLYALILTLAYPPVSLGFLTFPALTGFLFILQNKTIKSTFRLAFLFGLFHHGTLLYWIGWAVRPIWLGALATLAGILVLSLYLTIALSLFQLVWRKAPVTGIWSFPFFIVTQEYLRSLGELGFPWTNLSYTFTSYPHLIQYASFTGDLGVSFWICLVSVIFFSAIKARHNRLKLLNHWLLVATTVVFPLVYGFVVVPAQRSNVGLRVALLQGNIDSNLKWDSAYTKYSFVVFDSLAKVAAPHSDLLIWPETAAPCYLLYEPDYFLAVARTTFLTHKPLLVGTLDYQTPEPGKYIFFNAAVQFDSLGNVSPPYRKIHLVPFGEKIPFREKVKILERIQVGQADFTPGDQYTTFPTPTTGRSNYSVLICFESVFPDLVRRFVRAGADFLVNITNDGWFGRTSGPYQHAAMVVYRAIENRTSIARCANSGISLFVDRWGRRYEVSSLYTREVRTGWLDPSRQPTVYTEYGDWFAKLISGFTLLILVLVSMFKRR